MGAKGQEWNGGGLTLLSHERRREIGAAQGKKVREQKQGWPKPVAYLATDPFYHETTNAEFNRRVAVSKAKRGIVDNSDDKLEW